MNQSINFCELDLYMIPSNRLNFGQASFNGLYSRYKQNAKRRNIDFELTKEEFRIITQGNCHYCGIEPRTEYTCDKSVFGYYTYNGVDRINSCLGYINSNVVSCCKNCNYAKRNLNYDDFIKWVKRIYEYNFLR